MVGSITWEACEMKMPKNGDETAKRLRFYAPQFNFEEMLFAIIAAVGIIGICVLLWQHQLSLALLLVLGCMIAMFSLSPLYKYRTHKCLIRELYQSEYRIKAQSVLAIEIPNCIENVHFAYGYDGTDDPEAKPVLAEQLWDDENEKLTVEYYACKSHSIIETKSGFRLEILEVNEEDITIDFIAVKLFGLWIKP